MLRALHRCLPRSHPDTPPGDDGAPVGGPGVVPPWLAFHEAGHAVARLALDERMPTAPAPIWRVVVRRRGRWAEPYVDVLDRVAADGLQGIVEGRDRCRRSEWEDAVRCGGPRLAWAREALWLEVLGRLAGPAAEARWRGPAEEALLPRLPQLGDGEDALDDLRRLGREGELPAAWREAWALVEDVWPAVEAVADALLEREELAGEEVGRIAAAAMPGRFPLVEGGLGGTL